MQQRTIICTRIRERLEDVGWSPLDLAAAIRTAEKTVYRWVSGEYAPRSEYLVSISRALDVSPLYLLGVSDDPGSADAGGVVIDARVATLAQARARVAGDDDAPPEGGASV